MADNGWLSRPQYVVFPKDPQGFAIDDQYYVGSSGLLVKPITEEGKTEAEVYLSDNEVRSDVSHYRKSSSHMVCYSFESCI